ncbi:DUF721 domain-containing protein [Yoonia vestfoldensis]|uniref:DUF721 domain-containing protein n=1 Tax=Yoonia vestfoldensis TaxID=245188 RepID=UPI00037FD5E1|nr:DUF721 domain-containing protein [Yoonia vestfoldensis]
MKQPRPNGTTYGFSRAAALVQTRIRSASEKRGFAVTRLLTHWAEVVGDITAQIATPVNVSYGRGGMGATLTLLTTGAQAPMLEMQKDQIRDKVNACYGYRAIARVRITQTAPTGFADGRVAFAPAPKRVTQPSADVICKATALSEKIDSDDLRAALARLGGHVLAKQKN